MFALSCISQLQIWCKNITWNKCRSQESKRYPDDQGRGALERIIEGYRCYHVGNGKDGEGPLITEEEGRREGKK